MTSFASELATISFDANPTTQHFKIVLEERANCGSFSFDLAFVATPIEANANLFPLDSLSTINHWCEQKGLAFTMRDAPA